MKKILLIMTALCIVGGIFFLYSWRYHLLIKSLRNNKFFSEQYMEKHPEASLLTHTQFLELGWVASERENSSFYPNHSVHKSPGVIRIGMFGGSMMVRGGRTENRDYSYPGLIYEKFIENGFNKVEVINFAVESYGMFQEYMMWDFLAQKYDLDYIIFTIHDVFPYRDMTFQEHPSFPLHARYIMDHRDVRFVSVVGDSRQKAYELYSGGLPYLRYLLYDKNIPFALKIFLPQSLFSKMNPFYYWHDKSRNEELLSIYAILLERVAHKARHVIIVANQLDGKELSKRINASNVHIFIPSYQKFLGPFHYSDNVHTGPLGNILIADEFFAYLTGKDSWKNVFLKIQPCSRSIKAQEHGITGELSDYDHFSIQAGDNTVANMADSQRYDNRDLGKSLFGGNKNKSFLMLPIIHIRDIKFLSLPFDLKEGQEVFLSFRSGSQKRFILIGAVHASNKIVGELELAKCKIEQDSVYLDDPEILKQLKGISEADIFINNRNVLKLTLAHEERLKRLNLIFHEKKGNVAYLRSNDRNFFNGDPFDLKGGTVDFVVTKKNGEQQRCPILSYQFVPFEKPILNPYKELIQELNNDKPKV